MIATTRSLTNAAWLREMGADEVTVDNGEISADIRRLVPSGVDAALEIVGAATLRDTIRTLRPLGAVSVIGLLGGPPVLESFHLMQDLPGGTRLNFFPSGFLGTAALPLESSPLPRVAQDVAARLMPSIRVATFDFDDVRHAHSLMESDRALGKLVVRL